MRFVSSGSTGFAVLRREANEGGFFRPIVKEVVEKYLDCGNLRCGLARIRCPDCAEERLTFLEPEGKVDPMLCPNSEASSRTAKRRPKCGSFAVLMVCMSAVK
jgi:ribosomal protein S27E